MVWGIHRAFLLLGLFTIVTAWVFKGLHSDDGASVSRGEGAVAQSPHEAAVPQPQVH
jgi:hypothetical protein